MTRAEEIVLWALPVAAVVVGVVVLVGSCRGTLDGGRATAGDAEPPAPQDDPWREPFDQSPRWSPDGRTIAFSRALDHTLRVVDVRSGRSSRLAEDAGVIFSWSPDGRTVVYVGDEDTLWSVDLRDRRQVELLDHVSGLSARPWSPDGRSLVITSTRDRTHSRHCFIGLERTCTELYLVSTDGGKARRLTHDQSYEKEPVWSPDGRRIALLSGHEPDEPHWRDVRVVDVADGSSRTVTHDGLVEMWVEWQTDETLLVDVEHELVTVRLDNGARAPVPTAPEPSNDAIASPFDGTLAYLSYDDDNGRHCSEGGPGPSDSGYCSPHSELYLRRPGKRPLRITRSRVDEGVPAWSPDGRTLAFESGGRLELLDVSGRHLRPLVRD